MWIWVIAAIIAIVIDWCLASLAAGIAADKGYGEGTWKWICFFFGIIGYILVAAMPDLKTREVLEKVNAIGKECPIMSRLARLSTIWMGHGHAKCVGKRTHMTH